MSREDEELALLRQLFSVDYEPTGRWVRVKGYRIHAPGWNRSVSDTAFQILPTYPAPPYGFYVPVGIRHNGAVPENYKEPAPAQPPFGPESWAMFSWTPEDGQWRPGSTVHNGSNLCDWVRGFAQRFQGGA